MCTPENLLVSLACWELESIDFNFDKGSINRVLLLLLLLLWDVKPTYYAAGF
jgi:hypothetical protein